MAYIKFVKNVSPEQKAVLEKLLEFNPDLEIHWDDSLNVATLIAGKLKGPKDTVSHDAAIEFLDGIKVLFKMEDPRNELVGSKKNTDNKGIVSFLMQQTFKGIPVEGGSLRILFTPDGSVKWISSKYIPGVTVDTTPKISQDLAINALKKSIADGENMTANVVGLSIVKSNKKWNLAYGIWVTDRNGRRPFMYYVSAEDGRVLYGYSLSLAACNPRIDGSGKGGYAEGGNSVSLNTCFDGVKNIFRLIDSSRQSKNPPGPRIIVCDFGTPSLRTDNQIGYYPVEESGVFDGRNVYLISSDPNNVWDSDGGYAQDTSGNQVKRWCEDQGPEVDLAIFMGKIVDHYRDNYGQNSFDDNGTDVWAGAHDQYMWGMGANYEPANIPYSAGGRNAPYAGFYFGDGDHDDFYYLYDRGDYNKATKCAYGSCYFAPSPALADPNASFMLSRPNDGMGLKSLTLLDVAAHEFTHAFVDKTIGLEHKCPISPHCYDHPEDHDCLQNRHNVSWQSHILHEAIADIFAAIITKDPDRGKDCIIDNVYHYTCFRTANDPANQDTTLRKAVHRSPNHMAQYYDSLGTGYLNCTQASQLDGCNPQRYIGPVVYAAHLLANGGAHPKSPFRVENNGIGYEKLGQILFRAIKMYGLSRMEFIDLYNGMKYSVMDLYDLDPQFDDIKKALRNAFLAVGILQMIAPPPPPPVLVARICWPWPFPWPWPEYDPVPWDDWPILSGISPVVLNPGPLSESVVKRIGLASQRIIDKFDGSPDIKVFRRSTQKGVNMHESPGEEIKSLAGTKEAYASLKVTNKSVEKAGFDIDLYVCPADKLVNTSSWTWIDSTYLEVEPNARGVAEVRIPGAKLKRAIGRSEGKVCIITQYAKAGALMADGGIARKKVKREVFRPEASCVTYKVMDMQ